MSQNTELVRQILTKQAPMPEAAALEHLIAGLKADLDFGLARELLAEIPSPSRTTWAVQQLALCTYKDEELPPSQRLADALLLLEGVGLRDRNTTDAETLALGGAIYKRKWEAEGQLEDLYQALTFYEAAWRRNPKQDQGYGGLNAAFVLDLLASRAAVLARRTGLDPREATEVVRLRTQAEDLRRQILAEFPQANAEARGTAAAAQAEPYWQLVTIAEIQFGLQDYAEAGQWLARARGAPHSEWQLQSTYRQLVALARLQGVQPMTEAQPRTQWHPAWQALAELLGDDMPLAISGAGGKTGLALSGGGFRASLFHLGVLARLAELDVLRSVEVLSTVSGGSIVGALYYLEVQNLLQTRNDPDISHSDYIEIVRRLQDRFLAGVQRNLRVRALANLVDNFKFAFGSSYTRSHRMGELYERELYSRIADRPQAVAPRTMRQLLVQPADRKDAATAFKPKFSNWRRRAKVPVLLLNTTSLNTGHVWHFTARWMGEPPGLFDTEIDVNPRYRRLWYEDAPAANLQDYRLGHAVAASACVPGLFEPLTIQGLYADRTVRLVDGGVHDNQGIQGLLDEGCTLILCSDASGQMPELARPSGSVVGVPLRTSSILQARVREAEYQDLRGRVESRQLQGLFFVHLKKDLESVPLDWIGCNDPTPMTAAPDNRTGYGVDKDVQRQLASIRTDLDSFTEIEAYSLMLSGYRMAEYQIDQLNRAHSADGEPGSWGGFRASAPRGQWPFLALDELIGLPARSADPRRQELGRQLDAAAATFFKIWKLNMTLRTISWIGAAALLAIVVWALVVAWSTKIDVPEVSIGWVVLAVGVAIVSLLYPILRWINPNTALQEYAARAIVAILAFALTNLHLYTFDRLFIRQGRLERLLRLKRDESR